MTFVRGLLGDIGPLLASPVVTQNGTCCYDAYNLRINEIGMVVKLAELPTSLVSSRMYRKLLQVAWRRRDMGTEQKHWEVCGVEKLDHQALSL